MKPITFLIIVLVLFRIIFISIINPNLSWPYDENRSYEIASNYNKGLDYTYEGKKTSLQNTFLVYLYIWIQRIGISKKAWSLFVYAISLFVYAVSLICFYRMLSRFRFLGTLLYGIYPSLMFYIGTTILYENITTPLMVIIMYCLVKSEKLFIVPILILISYFFKYYFIFVYFGVLSVYFFITKRKIIPIISIALMLLITIPVLKKNHDMFGAYMLSTQSGLELLQGHNPLARGSFHGAFKNPNNVFYGYIRKEIPDFDDLNEYEQSIAMEDLAKDWIRKNPLAELRLIIRKLIIYFLPKNFDFLPSHVQWNPINLIVHLGFLISLIRFKKDWLILTPVICSILMCVMLAVCYRLRYFAEPFMILYMIKRFSRGAIIEPQL
ncbi:MAG: hypothetical protein ABIG92_06390 [Candidatus Omnitrophota bacterium]